MSAKEILILMILSTVAVIQVHAMLIAGLPPLPLHHRLREGVIPGNGMSYVPAGLVQATAVNVLPMLTSAITTASGNIDGRNVIPPVVVQTVEEMSLHLLHLHLLRLHLNRVVAPLFL